MTNYDWYKRFPEPVWVWFTPWTSLKITTDEGAEPGRWERPNSENTRWIGEPPGPATSSIALNLDYLPPATDFRGDVSRHLNTDPGRGK